MIVFAHLLNDSSGSPRVLSSTIAALTQAGHSAKLYIGSDGTGCLSDSGIPTTRYWYHRARYRLVTLFTFFFSQAVLLCKLLSDRSIPNSAVIYVNTLLPFGAALYGRLTGRQVIYHVHEISITPAPLKWLLISMVRWTSSLNIYVSDAHIKAMPITGVPTYRVHNALDIGFARKAAASIYSHQHDGKFNVLMIASLRDYKGIPEFIELANSLRENPEIHFDLLVNDDQQAIDRYFAGKILMGNLVVHPCTSDTTPFYAKASLVLNLSRVDQWVETFGMTILEAMAFGIPVIVPPVGGPAELVNDNVHGHLTDSRNNMLLYNQILRLAGNAELCQGISDAGRKRAADFSSEIFEISLHDALCKSQMANKK